MAPSVTIKLLRTLWMLLVLCMCTMLATSSQTDLSQWEFLKVPSSEFVDSVKNTIDAVQEVTSIFSPFVNAFGDFRLSNAVSDCLDLLDLSVDHLSWSVSAIENPEGTTTLIVLSHFCLFSCIYLILYMHL